MVTINSSGTIETTGEKPRLTVKNFAMHFSNCESLKTDVFAAFLERKEGRMMLAIRLRGQTNAVCPVSHSLVQECKHLPLQTSGMAEQMKLEPYSSFLLSPGFYWNHG